MRRRGFSVVEIVIVVGLVGLVFTVMIGFQYRVWQQNRTFSNSLIAEGEARLTLRNLIADLRTAAPSAQGAYPVAEATKDSLIFYSDHDRDGRPERWRYFLATSTVYKGVVNPNANGVYNIGSETVYPAVRNVVNANNQIFSYYGDSYAGTSTALTFPVNISDIRLVRVRFEIDANPGVPPEATPYQGEVMIRTLKDNL